MSRSENGSLSSPTTTITSSTTTTPTDNNSTINHQRLCHIVKRDNFDGYGFNLHSEKGKPGQYIGKVDENSPAEEAGLRQGDRIIEVNGVNIGSETHKQVVQRIKAIANEVRLLVIDPSQEIKNVVNNSKTANDTVITSPIITTTSTITVQSSTVQAETTKTNQTKSNKEILDTSFKEIDSNNRIISGSTSPTTSVKNEMNSAASCSTNNNNNNNNNINKSTDKRDSFNNKNSDVDDKNIPLSPPSPSPPPPSTPPPSSTAASSLPSHQNGTTTSMAITGGGTGNSNQQKPTGLNLPMTAAEMRAKLLSRKKYDPKNDSVDLRKKFEIIQKL